MFGSPRWLTLAAAFGCTFVPATNSHTAHGYSPLTTVQSSGSGERTWTDIYGQTLQAEFAGVEGTNVLLRINGGQPQAFPRIGFVASDRLWITEHENDVITNDPAAASPPSGSSEMPGSMPGAGSGYSGAAGGGAAGGGYSGSGYSGGGYSGGSSSPGFPGAGGYPAGPANGYSGGYGGSSSAPTYPSAPGYGSAPGYSGNTNPAMPQSPTFPSHPHGNSSFGDSGLSGSHDHGINLPGMHGTGFHQDPPELSEPSFPEITAPTFEPPELPMYTPPRFEMVVKCDQCGAEFGSDSGVKIGDACPSCSKGGSGFRRGSARGIVALIALIGSGIGWFFKRMSSH